MVTKLHDARYVVHAHYILVYLVTIIYNISIIKC